MYIINQSINHCISPRSMCKTAITKQISMAGQPGGALTVAHY